jgi:hypothetical protein
MLKSLARRQAFKLSELLNFRLMNLRTASCAAEVVITAGLQSFFKPGFALKTCGTILSIFLNSRFCGRKDLRGRQRRLRFPLLR